VKQEAASGRVDLLDTAQEPIKHRHQLFLQQGELLLTVGMVNPAAGDGLMAMLIKDPLKGPLAGLQQGEGIFW
jgi:hypothetical protein